MNATVVPLQEPMKSKNISDNLSTDFSNTRLNKDLFFALTFLLLSLAIYVFLRPKTIFINRLFSYLDLAPKELPFSLNYEWFVFSLPGALWLFAFLAALNSFQKISTGLSFLPLFLAIGIEVLQYFDLTDGTFDWVDLSFYFAAWLAFIGLSKTKIFVKGTSFKRLNQVQWTLILFFVSSLFLADVVGPF